jgi:penicillin-binding protein 1A
MEEIAKKKKIVINYIIKFWIIFSVAILMVVLMFVGISNELFGPMPSFEELENPNSSLASEVYSADGKLLGTYFIENRSNVDYSELSPNLVSALIAAEDIRFAKHSGIDKRALFRVFYGVVTGNAGKGGGSTITQQLAKNLFPRKSNPSKLTLAVAKLKEWVTATKLERNYTKPEIIAMYFNIVAFGSQSYGIKAASKTFFNSTPDSLNLEQAALMVGVVNAPTYYSPVRNPERAFNKRNVVLSQMKKYGYITPEVYDSVSAIPIDLSNFGVLDHTKGQAKYFREFLRGELKDWCANHVKPDGSTYNLYQDGLKIFTTIDSRMQQYAEEAVREHLSEDLQPTFYKHWEGIPTAPFVFEGDSIERDVRNLMDLTMRRSERYRLLRNAGKSMDSIKMIFDIPVPMKVFSWDGMIDTIMSPMDSLRYYKYLIHAGLMSVEPNTGHVKAYVGGINYNNFQYDHVTLGKRQVGSTFKPFLYTLAMQEGEYVPCSKIPNIQPRIPLPNGNVWEPNNDESEFKGQEISLKYALATSNNWISGHLMSRYSPQSVIKIARKMGVKSYIPPVYSIALGSADLKLSEMTGAFNTFPSKGVYVEPIYISRIEDKNGNVIENFVPEKKEAMNEETAYLMIELLKGVVEYGTGRRLRWRYGLRNPIAGKTGTTNNQSDGWFMGIVPQLTTGVWAGNEDRAAHFRSLTLGQGVNMAAPIWTIYMKKIYNDPSLGYSMGDFEKPTHGMNIEFDCEKFDAKNKTKTKIDEKEEF